MKAMDDSTNQDALKPKPIVSRRIARPLNAHTSAHATALGDTIAHQHRLDHSRRRANFPCLEQTIAAEPLALTICF